MMPGSSPERSDDRLRFFKVKDKFEFVMRKIGAVSGPTRMILFFPPSMVMLSETVRGEERLILPSFAKEIVIGLPEAEGGR